MIRCDDPFVGFFADYEHALKMGEYAPELLRAFREVVWDYYKIHKRPFVWRETFDPYRIVVSEIMLQQTQTHRVVEKYLNFIVHFPTFQALASASSHAVLAQWVGLGYNRRALALYGIAQRIVHEYGGILPDDPLVLQTFKGLGPATASSIVAFAFNKPTVFIETNIRSVYLHVFFADQSGVADKLLVPLVEQTVDQDRAREWYYALMDCGVLLKKLYGNPNKKSRHYSQQSSFKGSNRQVRGFIIRHLTRHKGLERNKLNELFPNKINELPSIIEGLIKDGFIIERDDIVEPV